MAWRVGVDVGGTFTDAVAVDPAAGAVRRAKVLSTPREPWRGVVAALEALGTEPRGVEELVHASTIGTNMLLGQVGLEAPEAWLVTSRGFRDVLEIGRQNRPDPWLPWSRRPRPLVPRRRRLEIPARLGPRGERLEEPGPGVLESVAAAIAGGREEPGKPLVVVVSVLHCYRDPGFEKGIAEELAGLLPGALVEASCGVDPSPGEYERTSTAVVNAILRPVFGAYIERLAAVLHGRGFRGALMVMQGSGGLAEPRVAVERPVLFIESGPAAGAAAAAWVAGLHGERLAVGFDMGGTTAKAVLVEDAAPRVTPLFEVGGRFHHGRLVRGAGYPVRAPHVDLVEVSAGGGTIAWVDRGGALRVGPLSAGAEPGPACYGRGGVEPTVTDAHLVLGRLPAALAGGLLRLDSSAARRAFQRLASELGTGVVEAAVSVLEAVSEEMARALRMVTVERGVEPEEAALVAYGGAGPLHAAELAERAGFRRVIVPPAPGVFSALGLLASGQRIDVYRGLHMAVDEVDPERLQALVSDALGEALSRLPGAEAVALLEMRFRGMEEAIEVPLGGEWEPGALVERFLETYRARHGWLPPGRPVVEAARIHVVARRPPPRGVEEAVARLRSPGAPVGEREVYFLGHGWAVATVYRGGAPRVFEGPAVVEEYDSTILVPPGWRGRLLDTGSLLLEH